jgi:hypothetical protein
MKKNKQPLLIALLFFLSIIMLSQTIPLVPSTITFQGRIVDADLPGIPNGEYEFTFLIYDAASGGEILWSETH